MTISQTTVRRRYLLGLEGERVYADPLDKIRTVINSTPQAKQKERITVDTATLGATYTFTINGVEISFVAVGGTKPLIAQEVADAINEEALVRGQVAATADGVDAVDVESTYPGLAFTLSEDDAKLSTSTITSNDAADAVEFGRLVIGTEYTEDGETLGGVCSSSLLTAQVDTLTVAYAANERYYVTIRMIDGREYEFDVDANTDTATTCTDIAAAINARMPANTVAAVAGATTVTLTAEIAGQAFVTTIGTESATVANLSIANTTSGVLTDVTRCAVGMSLRGYDEESASVGSSATNYPANAGVRALQRGQIVVASTESIALGDDVYVETTPGSTAGKLYKASSATRIKLPRSFAVWQRVDTDDDLAIVKVDFPGLG